MVKDTQDFYRRIIMADIIKKRKDSYETRYIGDCMEKIGSQMEDQQESGKGLLKKNGGFRGFTSKIGSLVENRGFRGGVGLESDSFGVFGRKAGFQWKMVVFLENGVFTGFWSRNWGKVGKSREFDDFLKIGENREK